ncbi:MAG: hypothetical protein K2N78_10290, partial [Oscillospiraceae bacterium]|nr:hypothetical protein [Oscillospiraceae bacterium]
MKREENGTRKRRIPVALIATILAIALAGTALADHIGWVRIEPITSWLGADGPEEGAAYTVTHENTCFPAENLSEEVFAIGEEIGDVHRRVRRTPFSSWGACEVFLGVELANNSRLSQMQRKKMKVDEDDIDQGTFAYVSLGYANLMPSYVNVTACYREGNDIDVLQSVQLRTQYAPERDPEQWDYLIHQNGEEPPTYDTYVTAAGVEATIFTETYDTPISTYTDCYASFI